MSKNKFWEEEFKIDYNIFSYQVKFVYTNNIKKALKKRKKEFNKSYKVGKYVDGLSVCRTKTATNYIFLMPKATAGTLSHESYHAVLRMFEWIGAKQEEELFAYCLGNLVDFITEARNRIDNDRTRME